MATQLINIVAFIGVAPSATVALPHSLNVNPSFPITPDEVSLDNGDFSFVSANATTVTVTNNGAGIGSVNVLCKAWHTFLRAFGGAASVSPQPFLDVPSQTFSGDASISGDLTVGGNLVVVGITASGNLSVVGVTASGNLSAVGITASGDLSVGGQISAKTEVTTVNPIVADAGGTVTINALDGDMVTISMESNITLGIPSNLSAGSSFLIQLTQAAPGSFTADYAAGWSFKGGIKPVLSTATGAVDLLAVYSWNGTTPRGSFEADHQVV